MKCLKENLIEILVVSNISFDGRTSVLIAPVLDHCLPFPFSMKDLNNLVSGPALRTRLM